MAISLPLAGAEHAILNLKVVEGEGLTYALGSRASRGITVEVTDEAARPVPGVSVSFQLPEDGPTGVFVNGGRSDVVTTREDGRATVWGMKWNQTAGRVNVRVVAAKDGLRAGLLVSQMLDGSVAQPDAKAAASGSRSRKLLITALIAGAAGAGVAAAGMRGSKSPAAAAAVQTLSIGTPTVIIGAP